MSYESPLTSHHGTTHHPRHPEIANGSEPYHPGGRAMGHPRRGQPGIKLSPKSAWKWSGRLPEVFRQAAKTVGSAVERCRAFRGPAASCCRGPGPP